jgi:hypothetical protein
MLQAAPRGEGTSRLEGCVDGPALRGKRSSRGGAGRGRTKVRCLRRCDVGPPDTRGSTRPMPSERGPSASESPGRPSRALSRSARDRQAPQVTADYRLERYLPGLSAPLDMVFPMENYCATMGPCCGGTASPCGTMPPSKPRKPPQATLHSHAVQITFRGYAAWALKGYSEKHEWTGKNHVVAQLVDRWLQANQELLSKFGYSEAQYAETHAPPGP